ncbi:ABC transporter permease [Halalkalibacter sp. APA_J-10(15)]|uniref:ABC transporter permease n=1 Tax=unclassified Halalkalibacter TaxID=2893063 RepID=UPI001FF13324|nr:ABC transporter permease [Halalkalibacter sp. APA_J-10(15)]MCK0471692.1 ABC transporter permease [Halalkalibacter sp. APA_J-10(15)]
MKTSTLQDRQLQTAISKRQRPKRPSAISATVTFAWRALLKIKYVPEQLFDITGFPIIYLLMFTYLFGGAISGSTEQYLQFLLPGILVLTVVMITMYTGVDLNKDVSKGIFDRFRSLPIWNPSVLTGALVIDILRYSVASIVIMTLGFILGFRPEGGLLGVVLAIFVLLFFAFSLSWIWTTLGLVMRTEKALMNFSVMILFPGTFISNVFVDPETMPTFLQIIVEVNPVSIVVTAVRALMEGSATWNDIIWALIASGIIIVIFAPLTMFFYRNKK